MIRTFLFGTLFFNLFFAWFSENGCVFAGVSTLAKDGKTNYLIVLPVKATPVEQTAAKELKTHLEASTGAVFPVIRENELSAENVNRPKLLVGDSALMRKTLPDVDPTKIAYDGIVLETAGDDIVLVGHPLRGTLYAVYEFLEEQVGVRWWSLTETDIPEKPALEIPVLKKRYAPRLIYREAYYLDAFENVFCARLRCNGNKSLNSPEYGDSIPILGFVHTFEKFIPPDKYFDKHPEWFSKINGQRKKHDSQLCLTNEEMTREMIRIVEETLRENPGAKFISVSQNDWHGFCRCEKCNAVAEEEGGAEGGQAGLMVRFVNKIGEAIEKEFPDVFVDTLAYQYTRKAPKKVRPRKNVVIRLCSIECSFIQPLGEGPQNEPFRRDMKAWSDISDNLFVWDYVTNFHGYMLPHPNLRVLAPNVRFFVDNNTIGLLEQGDAYCSAGDFVRMRTWVLSKLLWNPDLDERKLFDEFLNGYYGKDAAPILKEYWKLLLDRAEQSKRFIRTFEHSTHSWLDDTTFVKAYALIHRALEAAGAEPFKSRLRRDKMPMDLVLLKERYFSLRREAEKTGRPWFGPADPVAAADDFLARCREFGVAAYEERNWQPQFRDFAEHFRDKVAPRPGAVPEFCLSLPDASWLDIQDFEFNVAQFRLSMFRKTMEMTDDDKASNGRAAKLLGNNSTWSVNYRFGETLRYLEPCQTTKSSEKPLYRLLASVRCDAKGTSGAAISFGVHDFEAEHGVAGKSFPIEMIGGSEYVWIDLGPVALEPRHSLYLAPGPSARGGFVYVDRILLVRTDCTEPVFELPPPRGWRGYPKKDCYEIVHSEFDLPSPEKYGIPVDGQQTADGKGVMMPGVYDAQSLSCKLDKAAEFFKTTAPLDGRRFKLFANVRCSTQSGGGPAILYDLVNTADQKEIMEGVIPVGPIGSWSEYSWYEIGDIPLAADEELRFSAPGRRGNVNAVYVDRLMIVREKQ